MTYYWKFSLQTLYIALSFKTQACLLISTTSTTHFQLAIHALFYFLHTHADILDGLTFPKIL